MLLGYLCMSHVNTEAILIWGADSKTEESTKIILSKCGEGVGYFSSVPRNDWIDLALLSARNLANAMASTVFGVYIFNMYK